MVVAKTNSTRKTNEENHEVSEEKSVNVVRPTKPVDKRRVKMSRFRRRLLKHVWLVRLGIVSGGIVFILILLFLVLLFFKRTTTSYYAGLVYDFVFTPAGKIDAIDGKTNILVLGKGGGDHEAPDLTDTIMLVSIDHDDFSIRTLSLPRDIWIPELRAKLNSTYYWGNQKQDGGGILLSKSSVEKIVGQSVQYGMVVDFDIFKSVIDVLGGVDVDVQVGFVDRKFPVPGRENDECLPAPAGNGDVDEYWCRYETIEFSKGVQNMDGETALKFVRSRNAEGDEGTDFARSKRQQVVVDAIKKKVLSREVLLSPKMLFELREVFWKNVEADIDSSALAILARKILQSRENINSHVLPEEMLTNPPKLQKYDYLYVFVPTTGDWNEVHDWVECILGGDDCG